MIDALDAGNTVTLEQIGEMWKFAAEWDAVHAEEWAERDTRKQ